MPAQGICNLCSCFFQPTVRFQSDFLNNQNIIGDTTGMIFVHHNICSSPCCFKKCHHCQKLGTNTVHNLIKVDRIQMIEQQRAKFEVFKMSHVFSIYKIMNWNGSYQISNEFPLRYVMKKYLGISRQVAKLNIVTGHAIEIYNCLGQLRQL